MEVLYVTWVVLSVVLAGFVRYSSSLYFYDPGYMSDLEADWGTMGIGEPLQPKCVDIPNSMKLCRGIGYDTMRLPNLLGHESMGEAVAQARVWVPLLHLHCHPDTKLFLCSLYSPVCLEPSIYPCRSLCEGVKRGCEERINNYGFPWPEILQCDKFPETLCIEQVNFEDNILPTDGGHNYQYDYVARDYVQDNDPNAWSFTNVLSLMRPQCVPIPKEITLCRDVGYKNMSLPNLLGHDNLQEVKTQANPWVPLFKLRCHPNTDLFLCSLYAPVCLSRPIYPCRSLCESVKNSCAGYMKKYGFEWPDILKCDKFPTDDNMCIKQLVSPDNEAANVCTPCKQPITFESLLDSYCWSHFVLKVKIKGVERTQTGYMRILTKGKKRFYKPKPMNFEKEDVKNMELIIHNGANCDCEVATNNTGKALLIGTKHGNIFNVTYISAWSKSKEFKKAVRAIRKKHDCKKEIESIANANNGGLSTEGKHVPGEDEALSKIESNEIGKGRGNRKKGKGKGKDKGKKKNRGRKKKGKKKDVKGKGNKDKDKNVTQEDPMANFAGIGCVPCKQPLVFEHLIKLYCDSNFAIKVKIKSVETDQSNGDKRLVTKKLRAKSFYRKENLSKRDIRKLQPVISGGTTCDCLSASPGKGNLFIMGTKRGNRFEISFLSEMVKDIGFISFVEAVEKGHTCNA